MKQWILLAEHASIRGKIREHYKQLVGHKSYNLEEIETFPLLFTEITPSGVVMVPPPLVPPPLPALLSAAVFTSST